MDPDFRPHHLWELFLWKRTWPIPRRTENGIWGCRWESDMGLGYPQACTQHTSLHWSKRRREWSRSLSSTCTLAPDPPHVQGVPIPGRRLESESSLPSKLYHPSAFMEKSHILVVHFIHLYSHNFRVQCKMKNALLKKQTNKKNEENTGRLHPRLPSSVRSCATKPTSPIKCCEIAW